MAAIQVKPTRMELSNLKKRKKVAVRGHKMMKDKRDELVRRFIEFARQNQALRAEVEEKLSRAMKSFVLARASMSEAEIEEALMYPARAAEVTAGCPIPTVGIGAGPDTDAQVLVWHDMAAMYPQGHRPKFVRTFGEVGVALREAAQGYRLAVEAGELPAAEHCFS